MSNRLIIIKYISEQTNLARPWYFNFVAKKYFLVFQLHYGQHFRIRLLRPGPSNSSSTNTSLTKMWGQNNLPRPRYKYNHVRKYFLVFKIHYGKNMTLGLSWPLPSDSSSKNTSVTKISPQTDLPNQRYSIFSDFLAFLIVVLLYNIRFWRFLGHNLASVQYFLIRFFPVY